MSWHKSGLITAFTAAAAILPYRIVKFDTSDTTVIQGAAASDGLIGIANELGADAAGKTVDVWQGDIGEVELGGGVTRGALLTSDSVGRAVTASEDNRVVGVALMSGVTGDIIPVLIGISGQVTDSATFVASGTITSAQLLALNTTPIALIAAPGANKAAIVVGATFLLDYGTVAYDGIAAGEDLNLRYTDGSGALIATVEATGFLDATADAVRHVAPTTAAAIAPVANAAIVAYMATGNIATGDSVLKYKIEYKVIDTAW